MFGLFADVRGDDELARRVVTGGWWAFAVLAAVGLAWAGVWAARRRAARS